LGAILWLRPSRPPPVISVEVLGYTNRIGPHAFIAVTNRSDAAITLNPQCMVEYAAKPPLPIPNTVDAPRVTSIDGNVFRVTELRPHEGFLQEFFVFPAGDKGQWKFVYLGSYKSRWLEARRSLENWVEKRVRHSKWPPRSKTWEVYNTEWFTCPP